MVYFFLSYARGEDDSYVVKFYRDLSREVRRAVGAGGRDVGFIETSQPGLGSGRSAAVNEALSTCDTFVALYSERYLLSDWCGKELSVVAERLRRHERATGSRPPALVALPWGDAQPVGHDETLSRGGLRQLIRLRSRREQYAAYVSALARQIVETAHTNPLMPADPPIDIASAVNALERREYGDILGETLAVVRRGANGSGQIVHFIVAAGTRSEMGTVRDDLEYYGERREEWAPYQPVESGPLGEHARAVAAQRLFESKVGDVYTLRQQLERARETNDIVVVIVDSWATQLDAYRRTLAEFDQRSEPTVAVLVPASRDDAETTRHRGELRHALRATLPNSVARHDRMFQSDIDSRASFDAHLMAVLEEARNRIFRRGRVFRRPSAGQQATRPILEGP